MVPKGGVKIRTMGLALLSLWFQRGVINIIMSLALLPLWFHRGVKHIMMSLALLSLCFQRGQNKYNNEFCFTFVMVPKLE